jgi:adenosylcobinamide-GDP ribazoletransferase
LLMTRFRQALAFLTRLPGGQHPRAGADLTAAVPWFPVVGIVVGVIGAATFAALEQIIAPVPAAALAFAATALATGGFHEDGLADSFDALAGGWDREQRLRILKDSRHGTFGVLALVFVSLIKVTALAELAGWDAAAGLIAANVAGRAGAVALMGVALTAGEQGLGADYTRGLRPWPTLVGTLVGVVALALCFGVWAPVAFAGVAVGVAGVGLWAQRKIGGVTGDILGAAEQVGEAVVLLTAVALI